AAAHLPPVSAVIRPQHLFLLLWIEIAVWPTEVVATLNVEHLLGRQLRALFVVVQFGPIGAAAAELVTTVLHDVEITVMRVDRDRNGVPDAASEMFTLRLRLIQFSGIEAPDSRARLELGA